METKENSQRSSSGYWIAFDWENRIALLSFLGIVTDQSIETGMADLWNFVRANEPVRGVVADFSEATDSRISAAFIRRFAGTREIVLPDIPRVVVAPQDSIFGMARMHQSYTEPSGVSPIPVRSTTEAWESLKIANPTFVRVSSDRTVNASLDPPVPPARRASRR